MTDRDRETVAQAGEPPRGRAVGHQGREELSALTDEEISAKAYEYGVSETNDDGTPRERSTVINELANRIRQSERPKEGSGNSPTESETKAEAKAKERARRPTR